MTTMNLPLWVRTDNTYKTSTSQTPRISCRASKTTMRVRICSLSHSWGPKGVKLSRSSSRMRDLTSKDSSPGKWTHRRSRTSSTTSPMRRSTR